MPSKRRATAGISRWRCWSRRRSEVTWRRWTPRSTWPGGHWPTSPGHPAEADVRSGLSLGLRFRSQLIQSLADAQEAVELGQASATASEDLPQQAQRVANLAFSQTLLAQRTLQPAGLDPAISVGRAAVAACPEGDPTRFLLLGHLAQLLMMRYRAEGQPADLEDAIGTGRRALAAVSASPRHGELGSALLNLGIALQTRFEQSRTRRTWTRPSSASGRDGAVSRYRRCRSPAWPCSLPHWKRAEPARIARPRCGC